VNGFTRSAVVALCAFSVVAACSDDSGGLTTVPTGGSTTTTRPASTTSAASTTSKASTTTSAATTTTDGLGTTTTSGGSTTSAGPTTTIACKDAKDTPKDTTPVVKDYPNKLSAIYGDDIDTGGHECFERVVINFSGTGDFPGYQVQYEKDPLTLGSSGEAVDLKGEANLVIFAGSWMGSEGNFTGETDLSPTNVVNIKQVKLLDNFESVMIWGIGLDKERPFRVFVLHGPDRLVVDIANDAGMA
jgi:hypothetical protein